MKKTDKERLKKIAETWAGLKAQIVKRNITEEHLLTDEFSQWAVTTPLYNIGEQVYQLSGELKARYPELPWSKVSGLRHRLIHDYDGVNWTIIVEVIFKEMEPFIQSVKRILDEI
ncbi:MAG: DUF86 domain-containing protein [Ruminococcaceae bacterium]|nr:DUF86 domain-containing protein [Oscillospiraceae bacterium]